MKLLSFTFSIKLLTLQKKIYRNKNRNADVKINKIIDLDKKKIDSNTSVFPDKHFAFTFYARSFS